MSENLDNLEECRNCANWINKEACVGYCNVQTTRTYANYWCDKFQKGKLWSERQKEFTTRFKNAKSEPIIPEGDSFYSEYCREFSCEGAGR